MKNCKKFLKEVLFLGILFVPNWNKMIPAMPQEITVLNIVAYRQKQKKANKIYNLLVPFRTKVNNKSEQNVV